MNNNHSKYKQLRRKYPEFVYQDYALTFHGNTMQAKFTFTVGEKHVFKPSLSFTFNHKIPVQNKELATLNALVFNLGMVEMLSYWKAFCSPRIRVMPHLLKDGEAEWWFKLYLYGLGEFFHVNGIPLPGQEMVVFHSQGPETPPAPQALHLQNHVLLPLGGGKDSAVGMEILKQNGCHCIPFVVNPRGATDEVLKVAGFGQDAGIVVERTIDPHLLELNALGYLNGHTPFSAVLAFSSVLAATVAGVKHVALSNESSASESTVPGTKINHQYSKSLEFEQDFRKYISTFSGSGVNYFSLLRPLNELQIAWLFSRQPRYFPAFKSCNVGSKTDTWCGHCPKCLFTCIVLAPFVSPETLLSIFGRDLLNDMNLANTLDDLCGLTAHKPFECVGTVHEVRAALSYVAAIYCSAGKNMPNLLARFTENKQLFPLGFKASNGNQIHGHMESTDTNHCLLPHFNQMVQRALDDALPSLTVFKE